MLLLIVFAVGLAWAAEPCRFVVMGDNRPQWGGDDIVTPSPMYQRAIDEVNLLQPEFVIIVGDLIYGYSSDMELIEREWEAFDEATARFEMPVYLVAGNHDIWDGPSEEMYQRRYGPLWYSFDVKECHFVVLDSEDQAAPDQIAGEQLEWLRADLAAARGKRIFAVLHKPLWEQAYPDSGWGENVHPLLAKAGADTVFAGHWHIYRQAPTKDGVRYIITGGAGAEIGDEPLMGDFYHYIAVTAPPAGEGAARLAIIRTGSVEPENVVTAASVEGFRSLMGQMQIRSLLVGDEVAVERLSLEVTNPFDESVSLALEFGEADGWAVLPNRVDLTLGGGETAAAEYLLMVDPAQAESSLPYTATVTIAGLGDITFEGQVLAKKVVTCPPVATVRIDGAIEEWPAEPTMEVDSAEQLVIEPDLWGGPEACSADVWLGSDARNLYVAVSVTDPDLVPYSEGAHAATADSIEIYLDGRAADQLGEAAYSEGVTYLVIHPGLAGESARVIYQEDAFTELPGVQVASRLTADGYEMEVRIPLSSFPNRGDLIGFDLAINDNSDPGGRVQLMWHGTADNWEDATAFGVIELPTR
jgi:predicted phosphodiesterase